MPKILIVDDDLDLLAMLRSHLQAAGFAVMTAANGREALKRARALPDLIILDLVLPELDGFTVCQSLKRDAATAAIPIMLLTGLSSQLNRFAGLECGADDYVTKPIEPDALVARVRSLLARTASTAATPPLAPPPTVCRKAGRSLLEED